MELTVASIIAFITLILGQITKKLGLVDKKYIPWQNLVIGVLSGVICWLVELEPNIAVSILTCLIASYGAGGLYDNLKVGSEK
jgi:uncharacterized membrane protein HdeD (DUF308 family)